MHRASQRSRTANAREDAHVQSQALTRYLADTSTALRRHTRLDALLPHLATVISRLPGFTHSSLYLYDSDHFYLLAPSTSEQLQPQTLPLHLVQQLLDDRYRLTSGEVAYLVPTNTIEEPTLIGLLQRHRNAVAPSFNDPIELSPAPTTLIIVPLQGHNSLLGLLICQEPLLTHIKKDLALLLPQLTLFANEITILLELTHLHEEVHQINDERLALIEVGRALSAPEALQDGQTVYRVIYEQIRRLMPVDIFFVLSYDQATNNLERDFQIVDGQVDPAPRQRPLPSELKGVFKLERQRASYGTNEEFMNYLYIEMPAVHQMYQQLPYTPQLQSMIFTIIKHGDEPVGMLGIHSYTPHSYHQKHMQLMQEITSLAAAAIKSARMHENLRTALLQAQESEYLKNRFLMTASHELRTPLTAVHGYLEMLDEMQPMLNEMLKTRFINNARRASEELVLIVSTIMDASRLDQDKVELQPTAVRLAGTVQTILEILQSLISKEERRVTVSIPEQMYIQADDLRLRQILLNLLNNALKYTPPGTSVEVQAEPLDHLTLCQRFPTIELLATLESTHPYALIAVCDHGPGIAPEEQSRLFSKFTRLDDAINSQQRGAGLGLYLCRQFTEAMGGTIWLESSGLTGNGCIFRLVLPLTEVPPSSDED
jgi:signal transduction histidine kinase